MCELQKEGGDFFALNCLSERPRQIRSTNLEKTKPKKARSVHPRESGQLPQGADRNKGCLRALFAGSCLDGCAGRALRHGQNRTQSFCDKFTPQVGSLWVERVRRHFTSQFSAC